ncbi:hypothetical protein BU15DRAFT_67825 [Melanogaster broomeanus]|nr:hypothetical protein BU15DRAFT_67825 [Melanogaster broomeanus]
MRKEPIAWPEEPLDLSTANRGGFYAAALGQTLNSKYTTYHSQAWMGPAFEHFARESHQREPTAALCGGQDTIRSCNSHVQFYGSLTLDIDIKPDNILIKLNDAGKVLVQEIEDPLPMESPSKGDAPLAVLSLPISPFNLAQNSDTTEIPELNIELTDFGTGHPRMRLGYKRRHLELGILGKSLLPYEDRCR